VTARAAESTESETETDSATDSDSGSASARHCDGRLQILAAVTERASVTRLLGHLGVPTEAPPVARARDPTDDVAGDVQLALGPRPGP
jgi:hypothetical protein